MLFLAFSYFLLPQSSFIKTYTTSKMFSILKKSIAITLIALIVVVSGLPVEVRSYNHLNKEVIKANILLFTFPFLSLDIC